uniref:TIR domain-containing protein n=1 Tax=Rhizophagus irregularis (strain DAOM 181602 / DAOM 197198 / MUCL 43194) TaxID=747089 RepID=U9U7G4_RHIID
MGKGNIDVFIAYRTSDAEKFISWNARWMERSQPLRRTGLIQEECQKPDFGRKGTLDEVTNRLPKLVFSISLTAGLRFRNEIHTCGPLWTCGSWNNFSQFLDDSKQFFVVSRRFLDNSLLDDLNNIIFFMVDFWMILGRGQ